MVQDGRYENFTTVYINVTDVNDNAPEFTENVYEINDIIEETDPPVPDGHLLVQVRIFAVLLNSYFNCFLAPE